LRKEIKSTPVYEDGKVYAFKDINPQAPVHVLIIPKDLQGLNKLSNAKEENVAVLGYLLYAASVIAKNLNLDNGYRIVINSGDDAGKYKIIKNRFKSFIGQTVDYIHVHLLGGAKFGWPPGTNF